MRTARKCEAGRSNPRPCRNPGSRMVPGPDGVDHLVRAAPRCRRGQDDCQPVAVSSSRASRALARCTRARTASSVFPISTPIAARESPTRCASVMCGCRHEGADAHVDGRVIENEAVDDEWVRQLLRQRVFARGGSWSGGFRALRAAASAPHRARVPIACRPAVPEPGFGSRGVRIQGTACASTGHDALLLPPVRGLPFTLHGHSHAILSPPAASLRCVQWGRFL